MCMGLEPIYENYTVLTVVPTPKSVTATCGIKEKTRCNESKQVKNLGSFNSAAKCAKAAKKNKSCGNQIQWS